jgi:hypothetical protein
MRHYPPRPDPAARRHTGWSPDRNRGLQAKFRRLVLKRDSNTCRRCGHHDPTGRTLQAHHIQAGYAVECGLTLCRTCHKAEDPHAR